MRTVLLLRHAQTLSNLAHCYVGRTDEPLCAEGVTTAKRQTALPGATHVYTSHLRRSCQTARLLYPHAELHAISALAEMDFGQFETKNWQMLQNDPAYAAWVAASCEAPCPGGEQKSDFIHRCTGSFLSIVQKENHTHPLTFVVHGGTIMAILSQLALPKRDYFSWHCGFCEGYLLEITPDISRPLRLIQPITLPKGGQ